LKKVQGEIAKMKNEGKTKEELLNELLNLRGKISKLEKSKTHYKKIEEELKMHQHHLEELVKQRTMELEEINMQLKNELAARKKTEEALRESEEMYKTLVKTSPDPVGVHALDGRIIEVSDKWLEMWGYESAEEVVGRNGFDFISPDDQERTRIELKKLLDKDFVKNVEVIMKRKDGTQFIGELNGSLIKDAYGKPKALLATTRDITPRKMTELALRKSENKLKQEVTSLRRQIQQDGRYLQIIGNSKKILQVIDLMHQLAHVDSIILIYGETGSWKDLIAKAIHFNSPRKEAPFLVINCAALPEQLIESELFGYVKGAFTGATQDKKGLFEEAHGGTIFLNEVGDIPLRLQGKLLDAIENQQIRRLGQGKSITVNVRIIEATNKDLEQAVKKGAFRKDLFYRLNVLYIEIPPLREREEDIPLLAKHFLDKYSYSMNKQIKEIS
jgi:PAS domain S-box-containing protein